MPSFDISDAYQYSDYSLIFQAKDNNGIPIDLSSYTLGSCIREKFSSSTGIASFITQISGPESGVCQANLSANQTSGMPPNTYIYSIQATANDLSTTFNLLQGYLNINPAISNC